MASQPNDAIAERPTEQAMVASEAAATPAGKHVSDARGANFALDSMAPVLAEPRGESKRQRDGAGDEERGDKMAKRARSRHDEFMGWVDQECVTSWNALYDASAWVGRFQQCYHSDEKLQSILETTKQLGFEIMKSQLKEQVRDGNIGLVAHEIVTKLNKLLEKEKGCDCDPCPPEVIFVCFFWG